MIRLFVAAFFLVSASHQSLQETRAGLRQVFHDDFSHFDHSKWTNVMAASGFGNGEFEIYSPESKNCFVKDGVFYLKPTLTADRFGEDFLHHGVLDIKKLYGSCTQSKNHGCYHDAKTNGIIPPAMSCKVKSKGSIRYGRVEVWAEMPEGDWLWPAIWLMPKNSKYGGWPRSGEIDVAELRGNLHYGGGTPNTVHSTIHFGSAWNHQHKSIAHKHTLSSGMYSQGFHKYTMDWTASYLRISVDDVIVLNVTTPADGFFHHYMTGDNIYKNGSKNAPFDQEFYVILNVAVGGTIGWFPDVPKNYPHPKPWVNSEGQKTSMEKFWKDKHNWYPTWHGDKAAMKIRSVTMWTY